MTRRDNQEKQQRSTLGSTLGKIGAVAVPLGMLAKWHMNRPRIPATAVNPGGIQKGLFNRGPLVPHYDTPKPLPHEIEAATKGMGDEARNKWVRDAEDRARKSVRWMTPQQAEGIDKTPEPKSIFHEGPVIMPVAPNSEAAKAAVKAGSTGGTPPPSAPPSKPAAKTSPPPAPAPSAPPIKHASEVRVATPGRVAVNPPPRRVNVGSAEAPPRPLSPREYAAGRGFGPGAKKSVLPVPHISSKEEFPPIFVRNTGVWAAATPKKGSRTGRSGNKNKPALAPKPDKPAEGVENPSRKKTTPRKNVSGEASMKELNEAVANSTRSTSVDPARRVARGVKLRERMAALKDRKPSETNYSRALRRTVYFNDRDVGSGMFTAADSFASQYRRARRIMPWVNRTKGAAEDVGDMASGKKVDDPFYKKGWFKMGVAGAAMGTPLFAIRKWHKLAVQQDKFPNSIRGLYPKTGEIQERFLKVGRKLDDYMVKKAWVNEPILTNPKKPSILSAKLRTVHLRARVRQIMFDLQSEEKGWDLRDARGRSARVYAPGSRRRDRREKTWDEKTDNIRAMRNIAAIGALGASGGLVWQGLKLRNVRAAAKTAEEQMANRVVAAERAAARSARKETQKRMVRAAKTGRIDIPVPEAPEPDPTHLPFDPNLKPDELNKRVLSDSRRLVMLNSLHRLVDAGQSNVEVPRPEFIEAIDATLDNRERRSLVKRALGGAVMIGGGALGGYLGGRLGGQKVAGVLEKAAHATRKNAGKYGAIVGAGLGGLGAGMLILR